MPATEPHSPDHYFDQGLEARRRGRSVRDNPYCAGSTERKEWHAGFCATPEAEDEDDSVHDRTGAAIGTSD